MRKSRKSAADDPDQKAAFLRHGFVRIHRDYVVNPRHVRRIRRRPRGDDWELAALWAAFGRIEVTG